ncbi:MAG: response regulator [Pseudomonadales bacterium]|nr:response regulator [Pseudomonadales bacterium]
MAICKILIVDDSKTDLLNLKHMLEGSNFEIITATSGEQAIQKAESEQPNLILLDIVMKGIDGYRACREITKNPKTSSIPVIFVSSKKQRADQMWAIKQGGKSIVSKPYTKDQIIEQISNHA